MKLKKKSVLKNLLYVVGFSSMLALTSCNNSDYNVNQYNDNAIVEKVERKNIVYDASTYTISYDSNDLGDTSIIRNIYSVLFDNSYSNTNALSVGGNYTFDNSDETITSIYYVTVTPTGVSGEGFAITLNGGSFPVHFLVSDSNQVFIVAGGPSHSYGNSLTLIGEDYYNLFAPSVDDDMPQVMNDFVSLLVGAISNVATGVAAGIGAMAGSLFLAYDGSGNVTGLSTFGGIIALFAGIALAIAITTRVYLWITSLGKN